MKDRVLFCFGKMGNINVEGVDELVLVYGKVLILIFCRVFKDWIVNIDK